MTHQKTDQSSASLIGILIDHFSFWYPFIRFLVSLMNNLKHPLKENVWSLPRYRIFFCQDTNNQSHHYSSMAKLQLAWEVLKKSIWLPRLFIWGQHLHPTSYKQSFLCTLVLFITCEPLFPIHQHFCVTSLREWLNWRKGKPFQTNFWSVRNTLFWGYRCHCYC